MKHSNVILMALSPFVLFTMSCSEGFKAHSSQSQSEAATPTPAVPDNVDPAPVEKKPETCVVSKPSQVVFGDTLKLKITYNFEIPADAKIYWNGTNKGVAFQTKPYEQKNKTLWSSKYTTSSHAGSYSRYLTVVASNGQKLCTTNTINFQLLKASKADENCVKLGGNLHRSSSDFDDCLIANWTLFRAMSKRNLVKFHHYGPFGMPNPASVNCDDVGGKGTTGVSDVCLVD